MATGILGGLCAGSVLGARRAPRTPVGRPGRRRAIAAGPAHAPRSPGARTGIRHNSLPTAVAAGIVMAAGCTLMDVFGDQAKMKATSK